MILDVCVQTRYPPEWIHDPLSPSPKIEMDWVSVRETWTTMEELVRKNLCKRIGVCNFTVQSIMDLLTYAGMYMCVFIKCFVITMFVSQRLNRMQIKLNVIHGFPNFH